MRRLLIPLLLLLLAMPVAAQRLGAPAARRAQLETQLLQRFVAQAGREMQLDAASQGRLARIVREVAAERRDLNMSAVELRQRLAAATRDQATPEAQFEQLLLEQEQLRAREQQIWQREQTRLGQVLTARQRAQFSLLWLRLQEDARGVLMQRGLGPRGNAGGPPDL